MKSCLSVYITPINKKWKLIQQTPYIVGKMFKSIIRDQMVELFIC